MQGICAMWLGALTGLFGFLKMIGVIEWGWVMVATPIWLPALLLVGGGFFIGFITKEI